MKPSTPGSPGSIVRRKSAVAAFSQAGDSHHGRNTFIRAGSAAMISPVNRNSLRVRATIDVADEAHRPMVTSQLKPARMSRNRGTQRFATVEAHMEMKDRAAEDGASDKSPAGAVEKTNSDASSLGGGNNEAQAVNLARKHRLSLTETKNVFNAFKEAKRNDAGGLDMAEFRTLMCRVFDTPEINPSVLTLAHEQTGMQESATMENFMAWYVQNMFTQVNALNASSDQHQGNSLTYNLSEKHSVSVSVIDNIKRQFDKFDLDKSGEIDFEEFTDMMCILLKTNKDSLSDLRLRKFWREIEKVSTGDVGFAGFAAWYLKYFCPDPDFEEAGPVEAMYASFNPSMQRQSFLDKLII